MKKNDSRRLLLLFVFFSILLFRAEWARGQTSITAQTATYIVNKSPYSA